jgi:hypothetical protein
MTATTTSTNAVTYSVGGCTTLRVTNDAGSADNVTVNVPGLHTTTVNDDTLAPGETGYYRLPGGKSLTHFTVTPASGSSTTIRYGAVATV